MAVWDAADSCLPPSWGVRSTDPLQRACEFMPGFALPSDAVYDEQLDHGDGFASTDPLYTDQPQSAMYSGFELPSSGWTMDYRRGCFTPSNSGTANGHGGSALPNPNAADLAAQVQSCYSLNSSGMDSKPAMSAADDLSTISLMPRRRSAPVMPVFQECGSNALMTSILGGVDRQDPPATGLHSLPRRHSDKQSTKPAMSAPLSVIYETGNGRSPMGVQKTGGRRSGPLPASTRENAQRCRQHKSICIRCKKDRQPCIRTADGPCSRCVHLGLTSKWRQPCTKASFLEIVEYGTCNYISQRAVNRLTPDGQRRVRIDLPETLDLDSLLAWVDTARDSFDVRVRQQTGPLYVLNLRRCYQYLSTIRRSQSSGQQDLRGFIDHGILSASDWQKCVDECTPLADLMVS